MIDKDASVHQSSWIDQEGVVIDKGTEIGPNAVVLSGTTVGLNVRVGANATIGAGGFEVRRLGGDLITLPHVGGVHLKDHCEIQANAAVVKSVFRDVTVIGEHTVLAQSSFVSHGSKIGKRTRIAPGAVICGSVHIGDDVWIGPNATISNALTIGNGAFVSIGATLIDSLGDGERAYGAFARSRGAR